MCRMSGNGAMGQGGRGDGAEDVKEEQLREEVKRLGAEGSWVSSS